MDKQQWKKISRIFDIALTLPADRRTTYIEHLCTSEPELQKEMRDLLSSIEGSAEMLEEHLHKNEALLYDLTHHLESDATSGSFVGSNIGQWKATGLLGRGGMGDVYKVERAGSDIHQEGALKIIRRGLDTPENIRRFRLEKQILAGLHHPNIASLIDGGVSKNGLPYLVMEYVEGKPLLEYCDNQCHTINQRLKLFNTTCDAVRHAHKNLIVHRDLKPDNILVDKEERVKILDFGIAKLLDTDLYEFSTVETRQNTRLMSLEYAAPEQVSGETVTTSTDLYALGVLLYELLAGVHPFDFEDKKYLTITREIIEIQPNSPSQRLTHLSNTKLLFETARSRSVQPDELTKRLQGDLDAIVLKALRKKPEERYNSVDQLETDLSNFLKDKPVLARGEFTQYRVKKFMLRHRTGAALTGVIILMIAGFIAALIHQQAITREERDRAQLEATKAQEVTGFMLSLFEASDPAEVQGDTLTARELLERGVNRAKALELQPAVQSEMLGVMGQAYRNLALYEEADSVLGLALRISRQTFGNSHPEVAKSVRDLATLYHDTGHFEKADSLYRKTLAMQKQLLDNEHLEIAKTLHLMSNNLFTMRRDSTDIQAAEAMVRKAIAIHRNQLGDRNKLLANDLITLSRIMYFKEDRQTKENLQRQALEMQQELLSDDSPEVAETKTELGTTLYNAGRYEEAEVLHREALATRRKVFGNTHPSVGLSLNSLALSVGAQGNYDDAARLFEKALVLYRKGYGENNPKVANLLNNASYAYMEKEEYDRAEAMQRQALAINIKHNGPDSPLTAGSYYYLSLTNRKQGELNEAEKWIRKSLAIDQRLGNDFYTGGDLIQLALIEEDRKNYAAAESLRKEGMALQANAVSEDHHQIASSLQGLARLYVKQEKYEEAEPVLRKALAIRKTTFGDDDYQTAEIKSLLGACLTGMRQYEEAERLLTAGYKTLAMTNRREERLKVLQRLAELYEIWNKPEMAAAYHDTVSIHTTEGE